MPFRLAPCDLGDPGWGDAWFPHSAFVASLTFWCFFRPTPSWLPPGRYTHSFAANNVVYMQGCHLVESHKSAGCGPVRSPETVLAREQENKKANQKQHSKNRKKHTTKPEPNKDDREKWDRASARSTSSFGHHWTLGAGTWALRSLCTDG